MSASSRIADQLKKAMYGEAWHGPSVMEALEGITADQAITKPIPSAHSVWEITLHITAWFKIMVLRLQGNDPQVSREIDWPTIDDPSSKAWDETIKELRKAHKDYLNIVEATPEKVLFVELPGRGFDLYFLYHGMIQHCLYHAGQISLLKKSFN